MITYGNGEVLFNGNSQGFELRYKGAIRITSSPDNLFLSANRNKIIGLMLDGTDMPSELFNYVGEFRILSCKSIKNNALHIEQIKLQGVDYWELDIERWEDDNSLWGTRGGTYLVGSKQTFSKHSIVVNNNIKTQFKGQYQYSDGTDVPANELIHIHADGVTMTGGVHNESSVTIYPPKDRKPITRQQVSQIRRATTAPSTTTTYTSSGSSSGGSTGGGGGY
tara:strand:+ start:1681 stop:2346 length:666 start_codon:yes stop_codon:yes gene_type:complete